MNLRALLVSIPLLVVACKKSDDAPTTSATAKPVETTAAAPKAIVPADVTLANGEKLSEGSKLRWKVPGGAVTLAAIENQEGVIVRGFTKDGAFDVTKRIAGGDAGTTLEAIAGGTAIVWKVSTVVEREPEVGALLQYEVTRIEWDATAGKPVVRQTWVCDEIDSKQCYAPAWAKG